MNLRSAAAWTLAAAIFGGCASQYRAPVVERPIARQPAVKPAPSAALSPESRPETYIVNRGDTLYSIALDNGIGYRELSDWNGITDPRAIYGGQVLRLRPPEAGVQVQPASVPGPIEVRPLGADVQRSEPRPLGADVQRSEPRPIAAEGPRPSGDMLKTGPRALKLPYTADNVALLTRPGLPEMKPDTKAEPQPAVPQKPESAAEGGDSVNWGWPASGTVLAGFSEATNKGLDINGKIGDPVFASASGKVVYSGIGLRGYGKLIIIKHNQTFLSAYAHNNTLLVKEGQNVVKGQKIAEVGNTDSSQAKLHFEIRRLGKPVDPLKFLPGRPS
jgi:lipoprotein NlpD